LKGEIFDVVVIGGGCVGAGCAWEAATRGLKVALIERDDFAAGTSGYVETKIMIILIEIEKSRLILSHYTNNNSSYLSYSFPLY
jgi:glycine/D-amino acid oxidase-like deaminating enzyme